MTAGTRQDRSWTLGNSEHCPVGGPERSWVTWSGGVPREGVTVFRRVRGCRESWRDPPSLRTRPARGRSGVALTARSSGRARVTPAHLHALALSACYNRIALGHAIAYEKSLSAEQFHTLVLEPGLVIYSVYNGYWYWGRPSPAQVRADLRAVTE
jgi:hypothetical protein